MTGEVRAKLDRLQAITTKVNGACDKATEAVMAVDAYLARIGLGIIAEGETFYHGDCEYIPGTENTPGARPKPLSYRLKYARINGTFQIHVERWFLGDEEDEIEIAATTPEYLEEMKAGRNHQILLTSDQLPWPSCPRSIKLIAASTLPSLLDNMLRQAEMISDGADKVMVEIARTLESIGAESALAPKPAPVRSRPRKRSA